MEWRKKRIAATLAAPVALYGTFSFVTLEANPVAWGEFARMMFAYLAIAAAFAIYGFPGWGRD